MKLLIASDTHGNQVFIRNALETYGGITHLVHLGDGMRDLERIGEDYPDLCVYGIKGNNDISPIYPEEMYFELLGRKFFATHGHKYGVRTSLSTLYDKAVRIGADTVLFGHTHLKYDNEINGIRFLNPSAYGLILVTKDTIKFI